MQEYEVASAPDPLSIHNLKTEFIRGEGMGGEKEKEKGAEKEKGSAKES